MTDMLMILEVDNFGAKIRAADGMAELIQDACNRHRLMLADCGDAGAAERANAIASLFSVPEHGIYLGRSDLQAALDAVAAHTELLIDEGYASDDVQNCERALSHVIAQVDKTASTSRTQGERA